MFDIGFVELLVVAIVGLLIIGPEQLPGTVRTIMLWLGRLRRSFSQVKTDIERELGAEDIRRQLHNESIMKQLEETRNQIHDVASETEGELKKSVEDIEAATQHGRARTDDPA